MTMIIPKTFGKITKIGMRTKMKRGMSGRMVEFPDSAICSIFKCR